MNTEAEIVPTVIDCPCCHGDGRWLSGHQNDPDPYDNGPCRCCNGTGIEEIESSPVDVDDDEFFGAHT